ncbi:GM20235 [Drosophila sechellia]|uniref:GM20235 n=1 Tax=Drosophila sechellia TaxID=7238 RepID=B4HQZ9_DROSE|nr:GM20235 [Drosophila sechellia]
MTDGRSERLAHGERLELGGAFDGLAVGLDGAEKSVVPSAPSGATWAPPPQRTTADDDGELWMLQRLK